MMVVVTLRSKFCAHTALVQTLHNLIIYEAGKSRENASKYVNIGICENWCDTKSVAERRDCGWQFWVRILGQGVILGENLGSRENFHRRLQELARR